MYLIQFRHISSSSNMAPLIYAGTVITHMFGGSAEKQKQFRWAAVGVYIGKHFKMTEKDINILAICPSAQSFPQCRTLLPQTIFSMEVISIGMFQYSAFVPCIIASTTSYAIAGKFHVYGEKFTINSIPSISLVVYIPKIILFAILCGIVWL